MPDKEDAALMANLMRRAGFGATRDELDRYVAMGYEATVDELIDPPDEVPSGKTALLLRYLPGALLPGGNPIPGRIARTFSRVNTAPALRSLTTYSDRRNWIDVFSSSVGP